MLYGIVLVLLWSTEVTSNCGFLTFPTDQPDNAHIQNSTHFSEKVYEVSPATLYGCVEICKVTKTCTDINYDRQTTTCLLYSIDRPVTFESNPGDWLYVWVEQTSFPESSVLCDPSLCNGIQYCRTFSDGPMCLNFPS